MSFPGRNDPCHCGSGKKYKKCHLDEDQRSWVDPRPSEPEPSADTDVSGGFQADSGLPRSSASYDVKKLPAMLRRLAKEGSAENRAEFDRMASQVQPVVEYVERRDEIDAAARELEAHRADYEDFAADEGRYLALADALFAEEIFAPMRFSGSDVEAAFGHLGYKGNHLPNDRMAEVLRAAILHVAREKSRESLVMRLLLQLPGLVARGRYREGWLLQEVAATTMDQPEESNPFLFRMFAYGYDEWVASKAREDDALFRELGIDPEVLRTMDLHELDSWLQSHQADPEKARAMDKFLQNHPEFGAAASANLQSLGQDSGSLLDREDSEFLLLPTEEVLPWVEVLNERAAQQGLLPTEPSEKAARKSLEEVVVPFLREMAQSIFTPERIQELVADLTQYRDALCAGGDRAAGVDVMSTVLYLKDEKEPGLNSFLIALCWASIESALRVLSDQASAEAD